MKLLIECRIVTVHGKKWKTLPLEYKSKEKLLHDFMQLAKSAYEKLDYNYGRGAYFMFMGYKFEACDHYYMFSNGSVYKTSPIVYTLEEWFDKCQMKNS